MSLHHDKDRGIGQTIGRSRSFESMPTGPGSVNFQGKAASLALWYRSKSELWLVDAGQNLLHDY